MSDLRHFNELTPGQDERLALLAEECAEVIQVVAKIQRHGYLSHDPTSQALYPSSNRDLLEREIGDVMAAIRILGDAMDITESHLHDRMKRKQLAVRKYLHHQPDPVTP